MAKLATNSQFGTSAKFIHLNVKRQISNMATHSHFVNFKRRFIKQIMMEKKTRKNIKYFYYQLITRKTLFLEHGLDFAISSDPPLP